MCRIGQVRFSSKNHIIPAVELKTVNRCLEMRFGPRFFLLRGSFPSIAVRLQKNFPVWRPEPHRLVVSRHIHSEKGIQFGSRVSFVKSFLWAHRHASEAALGNYFQGRRISLDDTESEDSGRRTPNG